MLRKITSFLQNDIYYYLALGVILLTYDASLGWNIFLYALFIVNLGVNIKTNKFFYTFFALVLFEVQVHTGLLLSEWMFSSLVQVYYIVFVVRALLDLIKKTRYTVDWLAAAIALLFIGASLLYQSSFSSGASYMLKTCGVVVYMLFYLNRHTVRSVWLAELLGVLAMVVALAGIYALVNQVYWDNRLGSTVHDPNYAAMFYGLGLFASFGAKQLNKWLRWVISAFLVVCLLLTMSITGIFLTSVLLAIYFLITQGLKRVAIVLAVLLLLLSGILFVPTNKGSTLGNLQNRLSKFYVVDQNDYTLQGHDNYTKTQLYINYITNNRYYLVQSYTQEFAKLPMGEKLFGGNNTMTGEYRDEMVKKYNFVSHNAYIDMMFMMGILPLVVLLCLLVARMLALIKEYKKTKALPVLSILFVKAVVMVFGLTISYFPYRYYIVFMLL